MATVPGLGAEIAHLEQALRAARERRARLLDGEDGAKAAARDIVDAMGTANFFYMNGLLLLREPYGWCGCTFVSEVVRDSVKLERNTETAKQHAQAVNQVVGAIPESVDYDDLLAGKVVSEVIRRVKGRAR